MAGLTTPAARKKARELLLQSLYQWELAGQDIHTIEAQFYAEHNMDKVDREYYRELLHRIPAVVDEVDARYEPLLDRRLDELDPISKSILRIGAFEMAERIDVPYKVVINEAVNLAKKYGPEDSQKYINAVMDKLAPRHRKAEIAAMRKANSANAQKTTKS
jgi:N utilization substance protein B